MKKIQLNIKFIPIIFLLIFFYLNSGLSAQTIYLKEGKNKYFPGYHMSILEDKDREYTINDIIKIASSKKFIPSTKKYPNFGFSNSNYWIQFNIESEYDPMSSDKDWYLILDYPAIDKIELYILSTDGSFNIRKSGDLLPFKDREIGYRNFIFKINFKPGESKKIFMLIQTEGAAHIELNLVSPLEFFQNEQMRLIIYGLFYGILLIMVIYNLFLFFTVLETSYLYYVLFVISNIFWQFSIDGFSIQFLWPNLIWWGNKCVPIFVISTITASLIFSFSFLDIKAQSSRIKQYIYILLSSQLLALILTFILGYNILLKILTILVIVISLFCIYIGIYSLYKGYKSARFYIIALTIFFLGTIILAMEKIGILPNMFLTVQGQKIGTIVCVMFLSFALGEKINMMKAQKNEAEALAKNAQEKFRLIVENTNDIIFYLDENLNFIGVNKAIKKHLNINPKDIETKNLLDIVYDYSAEDDVTKRMINQKITTFINDKKPLNFKMQFKSHLNNEPKDMLLSLEFIKINNNYEIFGKVSSVSEDSLLKNFISETQKYSIGNFLLSAEEISQRFTRNLGKFIKLSEINLIRLALREILINSIEHGNLNISFKEKSDALINDVYFELISNRQKNPEYNSKTVNIEYILNEEKVAYKIIDEGMGFDYKKILKKSTDSANKKGLFHGRGLAMANQIFDEIHFNKIGNEVLLIKFLT